MPTIDFICRHCGRRFTRVVMRGEAQPPPPCPDCGRPVGPEAVTPSSVFEGISGFSSLSTDRN